METYANLVLSFYISLQRDVDELHLDLDVDLSPIVKALTPDNYDSVVRYLAKFGKAIENALISDVKLDVPDHPLFFKRDGTELPDLTYPLLEVLFHRDGFRRHCEKCVYEVNSVYVLLLRQIYLAFSKLIDLEPDVNVDDEISSFVDRITTDHFDSVVLHQRCNTEVLAGARALLSDLFTTEVGKTMELAAPLAQWVENPFGCHGPGAVADRSEGPQKWSFKPSKRENLGLYELYQLERAYLDSAPRFLPDYQIPARLCIVPKDFRGHRLICIEPKELMFAQQGLMRIIYTMVHENPLTKRSITFIDQTKSARACRRDGCSTIDLKDASDRISLSLLRVLLPKKVFEVLTRYRSSKVALPDGRVIVPKAAFTMGNALCFPIETLVFWAIAMSSIRQAAFDSGEYVTTEWLQKNIRVFGDDMIVPKKYVRECLRALSGCGLAINYQKTCIDTPVRESCGAWWFAGRDVRITRFRYHKLSNYYVWVSWADNVRELVGNGFNHTAKLICDLMTAVAPVPYGFLGFPGQKDLSGEGIRYNEELQRVEVRMPVLKAGVRVVHLSDWRGLYAWFSRSATQMATRHGADGIEWAWIGV